MDIFFTITADIGSEFPESYLLISTRFVSKNFYIDFSSHVFLDFNSWICMEGHLGQK